MKREERHKDTCICGKQEIDCAHCGVGIMISAIVLLITITVTVFSFTSVIQTCTSSSQCEAGPGERARCRGICLIDIVTDFCKTDTDCIEYDCTVSKCGADGSCIYIPEHGSPCDDGLSYTVSDQCYNGVCRGIAIPRPCMTQQDGIFVPDISQNGDSCSDDSRCTIHDMCQAGQCVGEPVICPNETCKTATCNPDVGCEYTAVPDTTLQPDLCTVAQCKDGEYWETFKNCFDGNPCTVDACFPLSGDCIHPLSDESCMSVCTEHDDCMSISTTTNYLCWDGMCAESGSSQDIIRISQVEQDTESCDPDHARLQLRFYVDDEVENGVMHIPLHDGIIPIYPHLDAFDVDTVYLYESNAVRTYFSMRSQCFNLLTNCYPFVDQKYEFMVRKYPCTSITGSNCAMDAPDTTRVIVPISLIDCPYGNNAVIQLIPELHVTRSFYTVFVQMELEDIETWITDVQICIPKESTLKRCILNTDKLNCPFRGCFDTPDIYLKKRLTLLSDGNYTSAAATASNAFNLQFSRGYEKYAGDRCENVTEVDFVRFSLISLSQEFEGDEVAIDVKYDVPMCEIGRRRLSEKSRRMNHVQI